MNKFVLFDLDHTLFNTPLFRESQLKTFESYEEVAEVLDQIKDVAVMGIYSEGELPLQMKKLTETKLTDHFLQDHLYIFDNKLEHVEEIFRKNEEKEYYLIDDRPLILAAVKNYNPQVHTIRVKRGKYEEEIAEGFTPDFTVTNLRDIIEYIKQDASSKPQASK